MTPKHIGVLAAIVLSLANLLQLSRTSTSPSLQLCHSTMTPTSNDNFYPRHVKTVGEIKRSMILPCNYIHDGFYVTQSNEITNQVYHTLMELPDDVVPLMIEVGGHDGITKSTSLKVSRCLGVNTMLIEASPSNFRILEQTRPYDHIVNGALCEGDFAEMKESERNSGENKLQRPPSSGTTSSGNQNTVQVPCTTIDNELDKFRNELPTHLKDKLALVFLVLDVEGFEPIAIQGINRYSPMKAHIEWTTFSDEVSKKMIAWAERHNLKGSKCGQLKRDMCFNFHPTLFFDEGNDKTRKSEQWMKDVFYGARVAIPDNTYLTSRASKAYMFYGE
jgi:hypothetical protein